MEKTRTGEGIFMDFQKNKDFYFLLTVVEDNKDMPFRLSYGYKDKEWTLDTLENILPPDLHDEARSFCQAAISHVNKDDPEFIAEITEAGLYSAPQASAFRP
jgi:hypothetical protein